VSEEDDVAKSWQMPLLHFTSKRRGSQKEDRRLTRSVRYAADIYVGPFLTTNFFLCYIFFPVLVLFRFQFSLFFVRD